VKQLDNKEVNDLLKGCQVLPIIPASVIRYRKNQKWSGIEDYFCMLYGKSYRKEISMLMTLVASALRFGKNGSQISLDNNSYAAANRITKQGISCKKTRTLLELLDQDGYIELFIGYYDVVSGQGVSSFFLIADKMKSHWADVDTSYAPKIEEAGIVVKDSETKQEKETKGMRGIVLLREELEAYNRLLSQTEVSIEGVPVSVSYKRIFHDTLQGSGRFYSTNTFQTVPKAHRKTILIGGAETVELDFSAMHPRMLYSILKISLTEGFDPYSIVEVGRNEAKLGMLCMLNADSKASALAAMRSKGIKDCAAIAQKIEQHNQGIASYFYMPDMWRYLQWLDSSIAANILKWLTPRGIACLPWHDSFVVARVCEPILAGEMYGAWAKQFGQEMIVNCKIEKK
jgi:hypothetical protein